MISSKVSYRILNWGGGQDGSRMIVALPPPRKILNLDPLRLLLIQFGTRLLFNTCDKTITILNFKISGGEFQSTSCLINKARSKICCMLRTRIISNFTANIELGLTIRLLLPVALYIAVLSSCPGCWLL